VKVSVLWGGGKDSTFACYRAMTQGYAVASLVTFILDSWPSLCHPIHLMSLQSKALGIPHLTFKVGEPYREGYRQSLARLKEETGIRGVVAGDIWIAEHKLWYESVCEGLGIDVILPLWGAEPDRILDEFVSQGFRAIFTCVRRPWFSEEWLGRELDNDHVEIVRMLSRENRIDPCGENGEYHTMVIDGPIFKEAVEISKFSVEERNRVLFMKVEECFLKPKKLHTSSLKNIGNFEASNVGRK